jgi:glutamyl-tRNA reductase
LEPTLVVVGLNHRTAPVEVRERFWMNQERSGQALSVLSSAEGVEEAFVFSTCHRTEFVLWGDPTLAANSVLRFLAAEYDLKLCEWNHFYRLLDEQALTHAFGVSCGLDAIYVKEGQIVRQVNAAWQQARKAGSTGRFLDTVLRKALAVRRRVRQETAIGSQMIATPSAALELARQILGPLAARNIVVLGAGRMGEVVAGTLVSHGVNSVCLINRTHGRAIELAGRIGASTCPFEERWTRLATADLVISATSAPGFILTAAEMRQVAAQRAGRNLVLIDLALPRDVDPGVREIQGMCLYDLDGLEVALKPPSTVRDEEGAAQKVISAEVQGFRKELMADRVVPEIAELHHRLEEICRQELESFRLEQGPFPRDQDQLIAAVGARIAHKIAGSLARELKGLPETRGSKRDHSSRLKPVSG